MCGPFLLGEEKQHNHFYNSLINLSEKFQMPCTGTYLKEEKSLRTASKISSSVPVAFICMQLEQLLEILYPQVDIMRLNILPPIPPNHVPFAAI
jgi:hypothetical protein